MSELCANCGHAHKDHNGRCYANDSDGPGFPVQCPCTSYVPPQTAREKMLAWAKDGKFCPYCGNEGSACPHRNPDYYGEIGPPPGPQAIPSYRRCCGAFLGARDGFFQSAHNPGCSESPATPSAAPPQTAAPSLEEMKVITAEKPLTVLIAYDHSMNAVDADIEAAKKGIVIRGGASEMYVNCLRLRCEQNPELFDKVQVIYQNKEGKQIPVIGLREKDQCKWPVGFLEETWDIESQISDIRIASRSKLPAPDAQPTKHRTWTEIKAERQGGDESQAGQYRLQARNEAWQNAITFQENEEKKFVEAFDAGWQAARETREDGIKLGNCDGFYHRCDHPEHESCVRWVVNPNPKQTMAEHLAALLPPQTVELSARVPGEAGARLAKAASKIVWPTDEDTETTQTVAPSLDSFLDTMQPIPQTERPYLDHLPATPSAAPPQTASRSTIDAMADLGDAMDGGYSYEYDPSLRTTAPDAQGGDESDGFHAWYMANHERLRKLCVNQTVDPPYKEVWIFAEAAWQAARQTREDGRPKNWQDEVRAERKALLPPPQEGGKA